MSKDQEEFEHDWYAILGCEVGSPIEVIQKAARKLAIKYHPDKTSDPTAPEKFLLIQKAKDILSDEARKKIIDDHLTTIKQREQYEVERNKAMDEKRKRFRDDLEQRVQEAGRQAKKSRAETSHEDILAHELAKNSKVLAAMRKENESIIEQAREEARRRQEKKNEDFRAYSRQLASESGSNGQKQCAIKIKWRKSLAESITTERLRQLFHGFGDIEDIVVDQNKKSTALLYFNAAHAARAAVDAFATNEDFRVSYLHSSAVSQTDNDTNYTLFTNNAAVNEMLQEEMAHMKRASERDTVLNPFHSSFATFLRDTTSDTTNTDSNATIENPSPFTTAPPSLAAKENEVLKKLMEAAAAKKKQKLETS